MAVNVAYIACAVAIWAVVIRKTGLVLRYPRDPAVWALVASAAFASLAFTLAPDGMRLLLDTSLGVPNLSGLVIYSCVLAYAGASRVRLLYWIHGPRDAGAGPAAWAVGCVAAIAAMAALFAMAAVPAQATDWEMRHVTDPAVAGFVVIYLAAVVLAFGGNARLYWRYAGYPLAAWVQRGVRVNAVGSVCVLGYGVVKSTRALARWAGIQHPPGDDVASLIVALGALLLAAGVTMPAWGPRLAALPRWVARYRTYRALYPLWAAVYEHLPHLALLPPRHPHSWAALRQLNGLLYYRPAVEIRDAYRELRPYMDRRVQAGAREAPARRSLTGTELTVVVEAAVVAAALRSYAQGLTPPAGCAVDPAEMSVAADAEADRTWLSRVSQAFAASPEVRNLGRHDLEDRASSRAGR